MGLNQLSKKAMEACRQSGNDPQNHFTSACKMVEIDRHNRNLENS